MKLHDLLEDGFVCANCGALTRDIYPAWHCGCDGFCADCASDHEWQECIREQHYWTVFEDTMRLP